MDRVIALRQISVTAPCYSSILFRRAGKSIFQAWGHVNLKRWEERPSARERERASWLWLLYLYVYRSLGLSCVNWASQEWCLFYLRSPLRSSDLLLFIFASFSLPCLVATAVLDSSSLFYLPNTFNQTWEKPLHCENRKIDAATCSVSHGPGLHQTFA